MAQREDNRDGNPLKGKQRQSFASILSSLPLPDILSSLTPFLKKLMPGKYLEHLLSIFFIVIIFITLLLIVRSGEQTARQKEYEAITPYLNVASLDPSKPLHKTLFRETLNIYYPDAVARNDSLVELTQQYAGENFLELGKTLRNERALSWSKFFSLSGMYISFIIVYLIVMGLTYYGVQSLAIYRFVQKQQQVEPYLIKFIKFIRVIPRQVEASAILSYVRTALAFLTIAILKGIGYLVMFSPAYVLAYSFRSRFDTDTFIFVIMLGVVSNSLLIMYTQKFYTFLVAESRKGYVQTAVVKNLNDSYADIPLRSIFKFKKKFDDHIFQHIYLNARYQYILTLKEQASFLITGLIIIEMALNIHGHLCYELLQNILYEQYDVVLVILMGIFMVVKLTEVLVDMWMDHEAMKYENQGAG